MKKLLFTALLYLFIIGTNRAQTGNLEVSMTCWYNSEMPKTTLFLFNGDSLVAKGEISEDEEYYIFENIVPGIYSLNANVQDSLYSKHYNLKIIENQQLYVSICNSASYYTDIYSDEDISKAFLFSSFSYLPNLLKDENSKEIKNEFSLKVGEELMIPINKHFGYSVTFGTNIKTANFETDQLLFGISNYKTKRYFVWNYNMELYWRTFFFDYQEIDNYGFFLDLGIGYNLPIIFHETTVFDRYNKSVVRKFHKYSDLYASMRIGFDPLLLKVEYGLFDYLKPANTQMPKLNISIGIIWQIVY